MATESDPMMLQTLKECNDASEVSASEIGLGRDMNPRIAHKYSPNIQRSLILQHHFLRIIHHTAEP